MCFLKNLISFFIVEVYVEVIEIICIIYYKVLNTETT